jgi:3-methyladenine DNA glycosylase/8-oxoguanine DNA glycosylase
VPCHRVIAAANKLGGFSSAGGRETKIALLANEGVRLERPYALSTAARWQAAVAALRSQDPVFGRFMQSMPPFTFRPHLSAEPLTALTGAIVNQQLSNKVAAVILKRVNALVMEAGRVCPHRILKVAPAALREAGLSHMKISYLQHLARTYLDGRLSPLSQLKRMRDDQIIDEFTQVKGIGRWTVEMYLIFNLGRADVLPVLDLGVRKSIAQLYSLPSIPTPKALDPYGARWTPYRTVASLYLWRALDGVTTFP